MDRNTANSKVTHEADLFAHKAWSDFGAAKATWLAGGTPGMTHEAASARDAMTDIHADPSATPADIEDADETYHVACLGQAADIARTREAALASIQSIMRALRGETDEAESTDADRVQAVDDAARTHTGLIAHTLISARTSEQAVSRWTAEHIRSLCVSAET